MQAFVVLCPGDRTVCQKPREELLLPQKQLMVFLRISQLFPGLVVDFRVHKVIHAFRIAKMKIRYFPASDVILTHKVSNKTDSVRSGGLCMREIIA